MNNGFLRAAVANPEIRVADPEHNACAVTATIREAEKAGVELLAFPELCLTGYTCGDLFFQKALIAAAERALATILADTAHSAMLVFVGLPVARNGKLYNACAVLQNGEILGVVPKTHLPEYGEFNELRFFASGSGVRGSVRLCGKECPFGPIRLEAGNVTVGAEICEDLWAPCPPSSLSGALVTVNLSASSETVGKADKRRMLVRSQSLRTVSAYVYADAGRGESSTDMVFSGHGIIAEKGNVLAENPPFSRELLTVADIDTDFLLHERAKINTVTGESDSVICVPISLSPREGKLLRTVPRLPFVPQGKKGKERAEQILTMQAEGLCKRLRHIGAKKLVLGVSGGLDSALALLVCSRALTTAGLPADALAAISMPGFGTSTQTADNAAALTKACGADYRVIDIRASVTQHLQDIGHDISVHDVTYENAQARMRTMILMDIANREGGLVVGTGDLSEAALGWCTYNGDHMSMYGVNASVPKTLVRMLVEYEAKRLGGDAQAALEGILHTEISPELLPAQNGKIAQKTEEILGKFELNDFFLFYAVRCGCTPQKTLMYAAAAFGGAPRDYAPALANFYRRFFAAQFKRSCSPDGVKVGYSLSPRGDWRMPSDACVQAWLRETETNA